MAQALMEWETLDKNQIDELMQGKAIAPPKAVVIPNRGENVSILNDLGEIQGNLSGGTTA